MVRYSKNDQLAMLGLSIICLMNISTYYLYDKINNSYLQKLEYIHTMQQVSMYENQIQLMKQSQRRIQSLRHDMKNHLLLMHMYISKKQYGKALDYLEEIGKYMDDYGQYVDTGNQEIDMILNYMLARACKLGCSWEAKIQIPEHLPISKSDFNILLSNLLENAIEALEKAKEKTLYIGLKYQKGILVIQIYNSFDGILEKRDKFRYKTRKNDKENHGIGMQNIQEIVDKYNGYQTIKATKSLYKTDILLYLEGDENIK